MLRYQKNELYLRKYLYYKKIKRENRNLDSS